jgi:hypothetical protein
MHAGRNVPKSESHVGRACEIVSGYYRSSRKLKWLSAGRRYGRGFSEKIVSMRITRVTRVSERFVSVRRWNTSTLRSREYLPNPQGSAAHTQQFTPFRSQLTRDSPFVQGSQPLRGVRSCQMACRHREGHIWITLQQRDVAMEPGHRREEPMNHSEISILLTLNSLCSYEVLRSKHSDSKPLLRLDSHPLHVLTKMVRVCPDMIVRRILNHNWELIQNLLLDNSERLFNNSVELWSARWSSYLENQSYHGR